MMAVEEHSEEDKAVFAMTTKLKHGHNGSLPVTPTVFTNGQQERDPGHESNGGGGGTGDDELTSLAWLQDTNLLKNFQMGSYGIEGEDNLSDTPSSDYLDEAVEHVTTVHDESESGPEPATQAPHSPYNPTLHANSKPPFSFSCLIFMAIEESLNKALPVKEIYNWILTRFPYFQNAPTGWKNSVRHNLSLSKCFRKVEKEKGQNVGKGSLWCIDPEFRPNLIQALHKAPSMAHLELLNSCCRLPSIASPCGQNGKAESEVKPCLLVSSQESIQIPSPELFPFLSRRLASTMKDPEVDAAATMLTLKNSPNLIMQNVSEESENDSIPSTQRFTRKRLRLKQSSHGSKRSRVPKPVITNSPSEDHTYSACLDQPEPEGAAPQHKMAAEANPGKPINRNNAEEEGAHALMNLAEIASKRLLRKSNKAS